MTPAAQHRARKPRRKPPAKFDFLSAIGELLLLAGVLAGAFFGWKYFIQPYTLGMEQQQAAVSIVEEFAERTDIDPAILDDSGIPVRAVPEEAGTQFAALYIPRLGDDWIRPITSSVNDADLTSNIGHYPTTDAIGEVGNVALAGHRTGWGDTFVDLPTMKPGDNMYVETVDGWYVYEYRTGQYVAPDAIEILEPVPMHPGLEPQERFITLQTCNPPHQGGPELFIGYGVMVDYIDRSEGAPDDVTAILNAAGGTA